MEDTFVLMPSLYCRDSLQPPDLDDAWINFMYERFCISIFLERGIKKM